MDVATLNKLLALGVQSGASDIHFRPGDAVQYRVHGSLRPVKGDKLTAEHTKAIALTVINDNLIKSQIDMVKEYDTSYTVAGVSRFRVNVYRQRGSLALVMRLIPNDVPTLESLRMPNAVRAMCQQERGLVLVTGATGAGKTTTLAAMIDYLNRNEAVHILTIEDPIEYVHKNAKASLSQREIGVDSDNFQDALRSALRQDPDVILVGEMRDLETIDIALKAAETGHLVLSTVHTTDAAKTIGRLLSVFPAEEQAIVRARLADNLKGIVSQRLLPTADGSGRALALEIMVQTKTVQEYILDPARTAGIKDVLEKGRTTYGSQSFDQHLTELYKQRVLSLDVARAGASNPADFERALNFE